MTLSITERWEQLSQALRRLRRDWAFTAAFVATLALGIAAARKLDLVAQIRPE